MRGKVRRKEGHEERVKGVDKERGEEWKQNERTGEKGVVI